MQREGARLKEEAKGQTEKARQAKRKQRQLNRKVLGTERVGRGIRRL